MLKKEDLLATKLHYYTDYTAIVEASLHIGIPTTAQDLEMLKSLGVRPLSSGCFEWHRRVRSKSRTAHLSFTSSRAEQQLELPLFHLASFFPLPFLDALVSR